MGFASWRCAHQRRAVDYSRRKRFLLSLSLHCNRGRQAPSSLVPDRRGIIVCDEGRHDTVVNAEHCAFDLLEFDGRDLRREPIEKRKKLLAELLSGSRHSLVFNECFQEDGAIVFREACKLGCEGVSKRLGSFYRSGRSAHWIKVKNPASGEARG